MAVSTLVVPVDYATLVRVAIPLSDQSGNMGSLSDLGYTENGCEITIQKYMVNTFGDQNGGTEGPPIEVHPLGEIHLIRLTLTRYDPAVVSAITAMVPGATPGAASVYTPAAGAFAPGQPMFQDGEFFRIVLQSALRPLSYYCAIFRNPQEINKGTRASKFMCVAECHRHPVSRVLYDNNIT